MASAAPNRSKVDDGHHGTVRGYGYYRCRCDPCRAAWRDYRRARRDGQKYYQRVSSRPTRWDAGIAHAARVEQRARVEQERAWAAVLRVEERRARKAFRLRQPSVQFDLLASDGCGNRTGVYVADNRHSVEWADPVFDAVWNQMALDKKAEQRAVEEWNRAHRYAFGRVGGDHG